MSLVTTAPSYVTGQVVTAAQLNALQDGIQAAFTAYTPTVTNLTLGNGVMNARYIRIGKTLLYRFDLVGGTTTTAAGALSVPLPAGMTAHASGLQAIHTRHFNGSLLVGGSSINAGATSIALFNTAAISTFTNGHEVTLNGTIELA